MQALPKVGCFEAFKMGICKYAVFSGRSRRSEYWFFHLTYALLYGICAIPTCFIKDTETANKTISIISLVYNLIFLLPCLGLSVRRLHDTGRSGWYILLDLLPIIGHFILIYFFVCDSEEQTNEYGPSPKYKQIKDTFLSSNIQMNNY